MRVLILSAEPRLVDLVKGFVGPQHAFTDAAQWSAGQAILFRERFDLVCLDFECIKNEPLEAFITFDNILTKENTVGCLMVRQTTRQTEQLHNSLESMRETIDMSLGKQHFQDRVQKVARDAMEAAQRHKEDLSGESNEILQIEGVLPQIDRGSLSEVPLSRVLYTCHVRKMTGFLKISNSARSGEIGFDEGEIKIAPGFATLPEIMGMFSWGGGEYQFTPASSPGGKREPTLAVIEHGLTRIPQQNLIEDMKPWMERYPVVTNHWEERASSLDQFTALHALMRVLDGRSNLSRVLSKMGSLAQEAYKAAYFAINTDMVYLHDAPAIRGAVLTYSRDIRLERERVDEAARQQTKAFRASSEERSALEDELQDQLMGMKGLTPHQIFGVWEGCGRSVVQERFYALVKEHHPDVYGGNVSGRVKQLAQEIFILIKNTYAELQKLEKAQTVPPPTSSAAAPTARPAGTAPVMPGPTAVSATGTVRAIPAGATPSGGAEPSTSFAPRATEEVRPDVQSRIERLSGFKQRQQQKMRRVSSHGMAVDSEAELDEESQASEVISEPEPDPEAVREAERQAKLKLLMQKASKVSHPNAPNPARDAFNVGFGLYKEGLFPKALVDLEKAYQLAPDDPLYQTFYAYVLFKVKPDQHERAEELLKVVLQSGHRQAMPDAYLFMGYILKARNEQDKAIKHFERALKLNPGCVEAEREMRHAAIREKRNTSDPGSFIKNLFKK